MSGLADRRDARRVNTLRKRLEAAVERALEALDALDGDPDLEPSLGAGAAQPWTDQRRWGRGAGVTDEREWECEDAGAQREGEGEQEGL